MPELALKASLRCGNPSALAELKAGETVLDLGSGGGIDVLLSASVSGAPGRPTAFLRSLETDIRLDVDGKQLLLVHGSPRKMSEYLFEDRPLVSFQRLAQSSKAAVSATHCSISRVIHL